MEISSQEIALGQVGPKYEKHGSITNLPAIDLPQSNQFNIKSDFDHSKDMDQQIYYISDLHLDFQILDDNIKKTNFENIKKSIYKKVDEIVNSGSSYKYLFILGDVSSDFRISSIFYTYLASLWSRERIYVVLGNHELSDGDLGEIDCPKTKLIIEKYRDFFIGLKINLIQNNMHLINGRSSKSICLSEETLKAMSVQELRECSLKMPFIVFGGTGFSQYNDEFNADNGIYSNTIISRDEERKYSSEFEQLYDKVLVALGERQVIIVTHMPKDDWSTKNFNEKWIYLNGHTHRNEFVDNELTHVFCDNQVGYHKKVFSLKYIWTSGIYDTFLFFNDGIHRINMEQYQEFLRGKSINFNISRSFDSINLLKREGIYCFIVKNKNNKLLILNGGKTNKLPNNNIQYYYDNMVELSIAVKASLKKYNSALRRLSELVKASGGSGSVHGSIVDIDFYNHIFLNPIDGTLTPYFAIAINDRHEFKSVGDLLKDSRPDLYKRYKALADTQNIFLESIEKPIMNFDHHVLSIFTSDTSMYGPSRIIKALQYITDQNVIRRWNDEFLLNHNALESKRNQIIEMEESVEVLDLE